jgi:hypothetical protein
MISLLSIYSGSIFSAAILVAERQLFRGWKAAPTIKTTLKTLS